MVAGERRKNLNSRTAQRAAAYGGRSWRVKGALRAILDFKFFLRCGRPCNLRKIPPSLACDMEDSAPKILADPRVAELFPGGGLHAEQIA
jgi:hypothetical protein